MFGSAPRVRGTRPGIRELNTPLSDLVPVAIEEGDAEFAASAPIRNLGEFNRRQLEHEDDAKGGSSKSYGFGQKLNSGPAKAGHSETGEEIIIVCPPVFKSGIDTIKGGINPGIEGQPIEIAVPVRFENPVPHDDMLLLLISTAGAIAAKQLRWHGSDALPENVSEPCASPAPFWEPKCLEEITAGHCHVPGWPAPTCS